MNSCNINDFINLKTDIFNKLKQNQLSRGKTISDIYKVNLTHFVYEQLKPFLTLIINK